MLRSDSNMSQNHHQNVKINSGPLRSISRDWDLTWISNYKVCKIPDSVNRWKHYWRRMQLNTVWSHWLPSPVSTGCKTGNSVDPFKFTRFMELHLIQDSSNTAKEVYGKSLQEKSSQLQANRRNRNNIINKLIPNAINSNCYRLLTCIQFH